MRGRGVQVRGRGVHVRAWYTGERDDHIDVRVRQQGGTCTCRCKNEGIQKGYGSLVIPLATEYYTRTRSVFTGGRFAPA